MTEQERQQVFETAVGQAKAQRDAGELRLKLNEAEGEARRAAEKAEVLAAMGVVTVPDWKAEHRERLRDTFAAAALTGILAAPSYNFEDGNTDGQLADIAREAWQLADEMLAQRNVVD